jgi:YVTN family beta-propeller protein
VVETIDGRGAHGVVIEPSSRHAYVANIYGDDVAVLDLAERKVVARIGVGSKPNGISFSPLAVGLHAFNPIRIMWLSGMCCMPTAGPADWIS